MNTTIRRTLAAFAITLPAAAFIGCSSQPTDPAAVVVQKQSEASRIARSAKQAQDAGDLVKAIELYNQSLEVYDELPGVRTNLGIALVDQKDIIGGSNRLKEEVALFPATAFAALVNLGQIYRDVDLATSYDYFNRALALQPNNPAALRGTIETGMLHSVDEEHMLDVVERGILAERDESVRENYMYRRNSLLEAIKNRPKYRASETKPVSRDTPLPRPGDTAPATNPAPATPPATPSPSEPAPKSDAVR